MIIILQTRCLHALHELLTAWQVKEMGCAAGRVSSSMAGQGHNSSILLHFKLYDEKININIINKHKESLDLWINTQEVSLLFCSL